MKVLITGSGGFIGSYLKKHLSDHDLYTPRSMELNLLDAESVASYCQEHKFDVIVHCAARGRETPRVIDNKIVADNILMFNNLAQNSDTFGKFINFSSGADFTIESPLNSISEIELSNYYPKHSYGLSKNITARLARDLNKCYNFRIFSVIDPSESENRLLKRLLAAINVGEPFVLFDDRLVDFISLEDIAAVVDFVIMENPKYKDMNLVYNQKYLVSEILSLFCELNSFSKDVFRIESYSDINYTGCGLRLSQENVRLNGIQKVLKNYI
jgi:nucleoside-diphosphate-sugar epimerase